ncbi:exodeoxyribonuclease III [Changpingibacter yushuensis]|uniref:exodeoxyribonuclease III n=1 Tax=Changpingibacter yushuensis TaxID=2758440 RepID=UPI0015F487B5|nr:exodeoxyribonuclease III [Changpingibacter yushuensis]
MRIATCNVNGLRAAAVKGMAAWKEAVNADVLLLQEVRAPESLIEGLIGPGYHVFSRACDIKGRAGVTVAVRESIATGEVRVGVAEPNGLEEPLVDTGRWIEVELPEYSMTVVSAYLHSGDARVEEKMAAKFSHLDSVSRRLEAMQSGAATANTQRIVVTGDFNIVHTPLDITNWKPNHNKTAGVLDEEIAYLDRWFGDYGYVDTQRSLSPDTQGPYTWWSQRGKAYDNNVGWRIDYQMTNPAMAQSARAFSIDRAATYATRFSDHAPLIIDYEL